MELGNFEEAISDFKLVLQVNPNNKVAEDTIGIANEKLKELRKREKGIFAQMFKKVRCFSCIFTGYNFLIPKFSHS